MTVHPKVAAAGAAGAVTTLVVWLLALFGVTMPAEVATALTTLLMVAAGFLRQDADAQALVDKAYAAGKGKQAKPTV